jgi:hypothetical protein
VDFDTLSKKFIKFIDYLIEDQITDVLAKSKISKKVKFVTLGLLNFKKDKLFYEDYNSRRILI